MEKKICSYETLIVINGTLAEDAAKATLEKFTTLISENGELVKVDEWGKRRLAYPINKVNEGYYVLVAFNSTSDFPLELERLLGINDDIMRSMTTRPGKTAAAPVAEPAPAEAPAATDAE